ncbi:MAG: hypothetical protein ACYTXT_41940 [Nostoc sp.]
MTATEISIEKIAQISAAIDSGSIAVPTNRTFWDSNTKVDRFDRNLILFNCYPITQNSHTRHHRAKTGKLYALAEKLA